MCSIGLSRVLRASRLIVVACLIPAYTVSMPAQTTTATNTTIEIGATGVGLLQAPDGNFYSPAPTGGTYPAAVTFAVSGLPSGAVATFTPSSVPAGSSAQTVTLNIQTQAKIAINDGPLNPRLTPLVLAFLLLPITMRGRTRKLRGFRTLSKARLLVATTAVALVGGITGCGGKGTSAQTPQSYALVVTATSGAVQHNSTLTLVVY